MVVEKWSLNAGILEFENVLKSLIIKRDILIGQMTGRDLCNQVITIWRGGVVSGY